MPQVQIRTGLLAVLCLGIASATFAQALPLPGVRAAGMGGAFTAVSDDASATVWNPAGLATGALVGLTLDTNLVPAPSGDTGGSLPVSLAAISLPVVGFSYWRESVPRASVPAISTGRNFVTDNAGLSLAQSVGPGAVGATARWVHDESGGANAFDVDLGMMVSAGAGRIGLVVRHLLAPQLSGVTLDRSVRGGAALNLGGQTILAADADFTTSQGLPGTWRDAAVGVERRPTPQLALRGGLHWNTSGGALGTAPIVSVGGSYAVHGSLSADVQGSFGSSRGNRGWGVGLRYGF